MRNLAVLVLLPALVVLAAPAQALAANSTAPGIVATFDVVGETFRAHVENPDTIDQILALQRGESTATIPVGALLPGEGYNIGWSWHTDPWNIQMAEVAIELCDGLPSGVEANLDYWLYTVGSYCPWSAVLIDVEYLQYPVGGVAEPPEMSVTSVAASDSSGGNLGFVAGIAAVAGVLALGGAASYARRRWVR